MSEKLFLRDKDPYSPSVGYAQCDISKYPELALEGMKEKEMPVQLVIGAGQLKNLEIMITQADVDKTELSKLFTAQVRAVTGSHLVHLRCEQIEDLIEKSEMGFVYYGSEASLMEGGAMSHLKDLAAFDRTNNPSEPI